MARYDLNIYTRLCEILNIYIWGGEGYGERGKRGIDIEDCVEGREEREIRTHKKRGIP